MLGFQVKVAANEFESMIHIHASFAFIVWVLRKTEKKKGKGKRKIAIDSPQF